MSENADVNTSVVKRDIPANVVWQLIFSRLTFQFGIIPLVVSFALIFCLRSEILQMIAMRGQMVAVAGHVVSSEDTMQTADAHPVYVTEYTYTSRDGVTRTGTSYGTIKITSVETPVTVLYSHFHPTISYIKGMKPTESSSKTVKEAFLLFGLGGVLVGYGLFDSYKLFYLLRHGLRREASLVKQSRGKRAGMKPPTYNYVYDYKTTSGKIKTIALETSDWLNVSPAILECNRWNEFCMLTIKFPGRLLVTPDAVSTDRNVQLSLIAPCAAVVLALAIIVCWR